MRQKARLIGNLKSSYIPWQAALRADILDKKEDKLFGNGVILDFDTVLTTNVSRGINLSPSEDVDSEMYVTVGRSNLSNSKDHFFFNLKVDRQKLIFIPTYERGALMIIKGLPIPYWTLQIGPMCLPTHRILGIDKPKPSNGEICYISSWGRNSPNGKSK